MTNGLSPASLLARSAAFARALAQRTAPPPRLSASSSALFSPGSSGPYRQTPSPGPSSLSPNGRAAPAESSKAPPPGRAPRPGPRRPATVPPSPALRPGAG